MPPPPPVNPQRLSPTESRTLHFYHGMGVNVPYRPRPSATGNALEVLHFELPKIVVDSCGEIVVDSCGVLF
jgi:hypothetical protein